MKHLEPAEYLFIPIVREPIASPRGKSLPRCMVAGWDDFESVEVCYPESLAGRTYR